MNAYSMIKVSTLILVVSCVPRLAIGDLIAGVSFTATDQGFTDSRSRMIGWQFTVGSTAIVVEELGFQDFGEDGLLTSHEVGIWRLSDQVLIASAVVPSGTAGTLDGFFRYMPVATPALLDVGTTYVISGFDSGGRDPHVWDTEIAGFPNNDVTGFAVDSAITTGAPGTAHGPLQAAFGFPTSLGVPDARAALMGPNLRFSVIPEPTSIAIAGIPLCCLCVALRRRQIGRCPSR